VNTRPKLIAITDPALYNYPAVFMHGRKPLRVHAKERERWRSTSSRAGCCLPTRFAAASRSPIRSARNENHVPEKENKLLPISSDDPSGLGSTARRRATVTRRDPQPGNPGVRSRRNSRRSAGAEGIKFGDRYGVIFSQFDISCALEKQDSLECRGYTRQDAAELGSTSAVCATAVTWGGWDRVEGL